jgi:hypothetical protein
MNEHDDDLGAEVEENAEFETAEFPAPVEDEGTDVGGEQDATQTEDGIDPDKAEI